MLKAKSISSLRAKNIKDTDQLVNHNGVDFTVSWGGEYYSANSVFGLIAETQLKDLRIGIVHRDYVEI